MHRPLALCLALVAGTALATPPVEVFTDRDHPVTHAGAFAQVTVYRINGLVEVQDRLSAGLPADATEAARIAAERLDNEPALNDRLMQAGQGLVLAHLHYRLDRYPAVVIDGAYVIYGVTDLAVARRLYEARP
jgi:integrating conjugative element protein (TIGR03757 family)